MGTLNNPGNYDCLSKLDPDEPFFLLRGKDPVGANLALAWRFLRSKDFEVAKAAFQDAIDAMQDVEAETRQDKLQEAQACAIAMKQWRTKLQLAEEARAGLDTEGDPERPVVALMGDGSFLYNPVVQSLGASRDTQLPILIIVFNNGKYAAMQGGYNRRYPDGVSIKNELYHGVHINGPDYAELVIRFVF